MPLQLVPDLAAMGLLLIILYFLRRRHPQDQVNLWLAGLLFIFLEAIAHAFYAPKGPWHLTTHILALDAYLTAGVIFLWAAAKPLFPPAAIRRYLLLNTPPLAAILTIYGLDVRTPGPYLIAIACGIALGVLTPFFLTRTWNLGRIWLLVLCPICIWLPVWYFAANALYRDTAYFLLFALYFSIAVLFQFSLPGRSLGKFALVLGFVVWSLVFLAHSWVSNHPQYTAFAAEVWDMQKFLVTLGLIMLMLERQVATNEWFAFHDQLTGLPNRRLFDQRLPQALQRSQQANSRTLLFLIDVNGFKQINDTFGHDAGDDILKQIAANLRDCIDPGQLLARLGGDEFAIIAADQSTSVPPALIIRPRLQAISQALHRPLTIAGDTITLTCSVGIAIYPDDSTDEMRLRRLADQRMYIDKLPANHPSRSSLVAS